MDSYRRNNEPLYDQAPGAYMHVEPDEVIPSNLDNPLYFEKQSGATHDSGYLAVQPDWLSEQWDLLAEQPWFRGFMQREDAVAELRNQPHGHFVVRVSNSEPGHYAISGIQHKGMDHMLILPSAAGNGGAHAPGNTRYRLGTMSKLLFNTVPKLIAYYIDHEYIDVRRLQGSVVQENQVGGYMDVNPNAPVQQEAPGWNKGEMYRDAAEAILVGEQPGAFVVRSKPGQGFVLSVAAPPPKGCTHHLITIKNGEWFVDNVPIGQFRSIDGLVEALMNDTLGVLAEPLVDIFQGDANQFDEYGNHASSPLYDTAGQNEMNPMMHSSNSALYDTAGTNGLEQGMNNMTVGDTPYDTATSNTGYLGVEPASDNFQEPEFDDHVAYDQSEYNQDTNTGYLGVEPAQFDGNDDENPYGDNGMPYNPYGEVDDSYDSYDHEKQEDVEL